MSGGRGLTVAQNERVRTLMRELIAAGETQTSLADKLGVEQGTISAFLGERQGTSFPVAEQLARLANRDVRELLGMPMGPEGHTEALNPKHAQQLSTEYREASEEARDEFDSISYARNHDKDGAWWRKALVLCIERAAVNARARDMGLPLVEPVPNAVEIETEDPDEPRQKVRAKKASRS